MKNIKILFLLLLAPFLAMGQSSPLYTNNIEPLCWTTPGGVDSTIYVAWMSSAGTTKPSRLHYFNVSGNAVTVSGGKLRAGYCSEPTNDSLIIRLDSLIFQADINLEDNDTVIVRLDSFLIRLDSLINNTTQPQQCDCIYRVQLENTTISIADNAQQPVWHYDRVARRDCGAGFVEVFRSSETTTGGAAYGRTSTAYVNGGNPLQNGGVIDSIMVFTKNPDENFSVYLSPQAVKLHYPLWSGDTSQLRYNTATYTTYNLALESVMLYALTNWAATHVPTLAFPSFDFDANVGNTGNIQLRFWVTHNPNSTYVAINTQAAARRIAWHPTASGAQVVGTGVQYQGATAVATLPYVLPCDTTIQTSYTIVLNNAATPGWYTVPLNPLPVPSLSGSVGQGSCLMPCPTTPECFTICNDAASPIPVVIVSGGGGGTETDTCLVSNLVEFPVTASGNSVSLAANYYHAVTISVTTGTVNISLINSGVGITTASLTAGQTFSTSAKECAYLATGFGINATGGAAIVSTIR